MKYIVDRIRKNQGDQNGGFGFIYKQKLVRERDKATLSSTSYLTS